MWNDMNMILAVYSKDAFKEYYLPSINNADYMIRLEADFFGLQEGLNVRLEIMDGKWRIKNDSFARVEKEVEKDTEPVLEDGAMIRIKTRHKEMLSIIVSETESVFHPFRKYSLRSVNELSVGRNKDSDIVYEYMNFVSKLHARIVRDQSGYRIVNNSQNGTYVNNQRYDGEKRLVFGDYINIMGLHMVYLGDILAIDTSGDRLQINPSKLFPIEGDEEQNSVSSVGDPAAVQDEFYRRAPRNYEKLVEEHIEIEAPPHPVTSRQQSLFLSIGPSLTMALPMLLGCMMMIFASNASGSGNSLFMFSGLIMSIASAAVGVFWALANIRYQKKEEKAREEHRLSAYSDYLIQKTEEIKVKYEQSAQKLKDTYPSASDCLNVDETRGQLWNRNRTHEDFLNHRLGLGDIPFQIIIDVPKRKFTLYQDELAEKPEFIRDNYATLYQVPVTLDLSDHKLIGIVGGEDLSGAMDIVKSLTAQIAAGNCYTDVKLGFIYDKVSAINVKEWDYTRWLPHVWSEDKKNRFVASDKTEASDVFYELTKIFRARQEAQQEYGKKEIPVPWYIIFISDASLLEGEPFAKYVFEQNDAYGLTTILLAKRYEELPNSCEYVIENTSAFSGMYDVFAGNELRQKIVFDTVTRESLERFARHLSSVKVLEMERGGEIPASLTFFDMLHISRPEQLPIRELWAKSRIYENIRGEIGEKAGGTPVFLDVHEKYHGPHGLVAGTTGSGKSETLQTYMLSLAINYSPDDIGFFIIDYKGGGMANLFDGLPHMVGSISNLSGNQVKRAMISIKSENRRRQRIFTENGVNNINLYTKLYKNGEAAQPIPHLFIIIDEFAELKREEPEFMKELISVAQVGRSLGVHLILATQKPSGTVDDNIWSNSKFRLCLRVQDQQDSKDMLHKPDAAYITQAGRCYLQVGNDEVYELFQSGFSGAIYDENMTAANIDIAKMIGISGKVEMTGSSVKLSQKKRAQNAWIELLLECLDTVMENFNILPAARETDSGMQQEIIAELYQELQRKDIDYAENKYNTDRLKEFLAVYMEDAATEGERSAERVIQRVQTHGYKLPQPKEKTQLDAIKEYLASQAKKNGYTHNIQLWMPILPSHIYLDTFSALKESSFSISGWMKQTGDWSLEIPIGMMDDPENQNQMPLTVDFAEDGHIAVCGSIVSGKSTMLQTMIYALIQKYDPSMVNLYLLDFSSKILGAFEQAPHVGGVMYENDTEKIGKFFNMIRGILNERKQLFGGGNYRQYVQVHGVILPAIVIFIDNYGTFKEKTKEAYEEDLIRLSKEGINHGIFLVVSGKSFGMADITSRVGENIKTVLCLAMADKFAYADLLHSMQISVLPEEGIKGRGLAWYGKRILEYQTALAFAAENDYQRQEQIEKLCRQMRESWDGVFARQVPEIPKKPVWSQFSALEDFRKSTENQRMLPVGYNMADASVYSLPLGDFYCYLVCGGTRTGKTNFMKLCIQSALQKDASICVIDGPGRELHACEKYENITYVTDEQSVFDYFKELTPEFKRRNVMKNQMLNEDREESEIAEVMSREKPYFIFISDLSWFVPFIYKAELDMRGFLETIIAKGRLHNIYFIAELALSKRSGLAGYRIYDSFVGYKTGIHFGGKVSENPLLPFDHIPYVQQAKAEKPGIGILPTGSEEYGAAKVVIPLAQMRHQ